MSRKVLHRMVLMGVALLCFGVLIYALSNVVAYFQKPPPNLYSMPIDQVYFKQNHTPFTWLKDRANKYQLTSYQKEEIQQAYLKAWQLKNLKPNTYGVFKNNEHVDERVLKRMYDTEQSDLDIQTLDLSHHIQLNFISLDRSIISFIDKKVHLVTRIKRQDDNIQYIEEENEYEVLMRLTDGVWKIENIHQRSTSEKEKASLEKQKIDLGHRRGINYYPKATPWRTFWPQYDSLIVEKDLRLVKELAYDHIRFFIPFEEIGGADIHDSFLENMDHLMATAEALDLDVVPTLLDFPVGFNLHQWTDYNHQVKTIMQRYNEANNILLWDLKNEPDIDFQYHPRADVMACMTYLLEQARNYAPDHGLTISWAMSAEAHRLADLVDVVSYHHYKKGQTFKAAIQDIQEQVGENKPIYVSEFGKSSFTGLAFWKDGEGEQQTYRETSEQFMGDLGVSHAVWCLHDYEEAPRNVFGWKPWIRWSQKKFGVVE